MRLTWLSLTDFRSYEQLELDLPEGVTVFLGPNGQGKTNIVEAVGYLATLSSHRVRHDGALVRRGAERAFVRAKANRSDRDRRVDLEIAPGRANRALVQGNAVPRVRDILGIVRTVLFAPEDLALVKGDPDGRRRFLDELLVTIAPRYAGVKADYDRVIKQKTALLKSIRRSMRRGEQMDESASITLGIWNDQLTELGAELLRARIHLVTRLRPHVRYSYQRVASDYEAALEIDPASRTAESDAVASSPMQIHYTSSALADRPGFEDPEFTALPLHADLAAALAAEIAERIDDEIDRGVCLVGPHRDDLAIELSDSPAKGYASHGESWSLALALRLGSFDLLRVEDAGVGDGEPILVLDDVFAELDVARRGRLAAIVSDAGQVLITTANDEDLPAPLAEHAHIIDVVKGEAHAR